MVQKTYRISFTVILDEESNPRKWVPDAINNNLDVDEDSYDYEFVEVTDEEEEEGE